MGKIKVKGSAKAKFQAELLEIDITIRVVAKTAGAAISDGKKKVEQFLSEMQKQLNVKPERFCIESDSTVQDYGGKSYTFTKKMSVNIKANLEILERITDLLSKMPHVSYSTNFQLDDISEKEKKVIQLAITEARKKAEILASCSGQVVSDVHEISISENDYYEYDDDDEDDEDSDDEDEEDDGAFLGAGMAKSIPKLAAQLSLPEQTIAKEVNVIFLIEPKA